MIDDTTIVFFRSRPILCSHCGTANDPEKLICSKCGETLPPAAPPVTRIIEHSPHLVSVGNSGKRSFDHNWGLLFQFLPSGSCFHSNVNAPVILGRDTPPSSNGCEFFDLSSLHAVRHGVSRHHCQLQRRGNQLIVTDLNSRNGTYVNGRMLHPDEECVLAHGDELVLGTLHVILFFEQAWAAST
jgi:hypothetical protein